VKISLLVVDLKATFSKKATGKVTFICDEIPALARTIQDAVESKEGRTYQATSIGYNTEGEEVARFMVTWSFKAKS
ncbi:MAG: thioesterase, partial [Bacteroidota bacterium]|nr:thioesterase [Bacteroidota bacterium]